MQYKIISVTPFFSRTKSFDQLAKLVNEAIALGWEPVGGVTAANGALAQAMIKRR